MSWELTKHVLSLKHLSPTEKAVAHCLAYHAPKDGHAYPSMDTIATESGLAHRRAAQKVVRRLERKGVIEPASSKKGGRNNPTHYHFRELNSVPTGTLLKENSVHVDPETASQRTRNSVRTDARDSIDKVVSKDEKAATTDIQNQMAEKCLLTVWNYYQDAFDKTEEFTPARKKLGRDRMIDLREGLYQSISHPPPSAAQFMACAIDMAKVVSRKKTFFKDWHCIFGKADTFLSLLDQVDQEGAPCAAELEAIEV